MENIKAYRKHLEKYNPNCNDLKDNRVKVSRAVFSYVSDNGFEYRKSFTDKPNTPEMKFWDIAPESIEIDINFQKIQ